MKFFDAKKWSLVAYIFLQRSLSSADLTVLKWNFLSVYSEDFAKEEMTTSDSSSLCVFCDIFVRLLHEFNNAVSLSAYMFLCACLYYH